MPFRLKSLWLLLMLWACPLAAALPQLPADPPRFSTLGSGEGMPSGVITSLAQDRTGFIWMGTARGLVRFDGYRYRLYANRWSVPSEETSVFVRSLLASRDGGLWVGMDFTGLARYDAASDELVLVDTHAAMPASFSVNALAEDAEGRLWAGTDDQGLLVRHPDGRIQSIRQEDGSGLPDNRIESLLIDQHGTLWLGTWNGLARRKPAETSFTPIALDGPTARITALFQGSDGQIWIGSRDGRLWRIAADDRVVVVTSPGDQDHGNGAIHALLQATPDALWIGGAVGVDIRATADGRLLHQVRHQPGNPASLASGEIRTLLRDNGGQFWVGGYGGGVQRHNSLNTAFLLRDRHSLAAIDSALDDLNVRAVLEMHDGRILLGTHGRGIVMLDAQLHPLGALHDSNGEPLLRNVRVAALAQTRDNALWIGSDAGLFRRADDAAPLQSFPLETGRARRLLADPLGNLWIGAEDGLWLHRPGAEHLERVHDDLGAALVGDINALGLDPAGRLWIGGEFGLALLAHADGTARRIEAAHPARGHNPDVLGLLADIDGSVWFDTPAGLFHLHPDDTGHEAVTAISKKYGISGRPFGANLLRDAQGRMWTQDHVLDPSQDRVLALGPADGAALGSAWYRAYAHTRSGMLLFGGTQGLLAVIPARFRFSDYAAPLAITDVRIDGVSTPRALDQKGLTLVPGQRSIAIEFASLDYSAPERTRYAYRLLGESNDWNEVDAGYRVATFANLAPGDYQFELRGSTRAGRLGETPLSVPLKVHAAWWQTWWARIGALVVLGTLLHGLIQQRTRWLRARQHQLERHVAARTRELQNVSAALQEKSRALEEASLTDPLTGLRNRRYFAAHIETDVSDSLRRHQSDAAGSHDAMQADLLFFMLDIDHFKQVNDEYGHAAGDAVLTQVAERLRACFRDTDHLVRWGGEEFLIVARHATRQHAEELAERVVQAIGSVPFELPDRRRLHRTCSLGHAAFPLQATFPHQSRWGDVVELADLALYAAKRAGRNGWVGIISDQGEPLPLDWRRHFPDMIDAGQLHTIGSLPTDAVRRALDAVP